MDKVYNTRKQNNLKKWESPGNTFLSKVRLHIYAAVHAVMKQETLKQQHCERGGTRRNLAQLSAWHEEERLTNKGRHHLLLQLSAWHESLHGHITRARLCFELGIFITTLENMPTPLFYFRSHLSSSPMGTFGEISVTGGKYRKHLTSERSHKQFTVSE